MGITKESKGITLLALIITIIVLVILAGVALNTLFGNNGILNNAQYGTEAYKKSAEKEAIAMAFADLKMKLYTDDNITEITAELLEQQLSNVGYNVEVEDGENGNFIITFKNTGDQYEVASNGSIVGEEQTEVAQQSNVPLEITGDIECTGGETTILVTVSTNVDSGATYIYHYQIEGGEEQTAISNSNTYTIEGLTVNNNYEVWVEAYNNYNTEHVISNHETVRTQYGPYITVPADFAYDGNKITGFNANAESGVATMAKSGERKVICVIPSEYDNNGTITELTTIGTNAFNNSPNIIETIISSSVRYVSYNSYGNCTGLNKVTFLGAVENTYGSDQGPFQGCNNLKIVEFWPNCTSIPACLFAKCGIESIIIPEGVTSIGTNAFFRCTQLSEVTLPSTLITINGFTNCTALESITIPGSVTTIGTNAFNSCSSLTTVTFLGTRAQWEAVNKGNNTVLTSATIHCSDD